jgi:hypothetical protein
MFKVGDPVFWNPMTPTQTAFVFGVVVGVFLCLFVLGIICNRMAKRRGKDPGEEQP